MEFTIYSPFPINTTIIRKYSRAFAILYSRKSIGKFIIYANRATTNS